jgi:hypothetical protein
MSKQTNAIEYFKAYPHARPDFVASKFRVSVATVNRWRRNANLPPLPNPVPKESVKYDAVKAYMADHPWATAKEVAAVTGCTPSYFYLIMKKPYGRLYRELNPTAVVAEATPEPSVLPKAYTEQQKEEPVTEQSQVEVADTNFLAYGKWMTRQELIGYLKGSVVSTLTQGTFTKADLKAVGWKIIKLSELVTD